MEKTHERMDFDDYVKNLWDVESVSPTWDNLLWELDNPFFETPAQLEDLYRIKD